MTPATGVWLFPNGPAQAIVDTVVAAEDVGIDEVWLGDEGPARDPFSILAAAAGRTSKVRLGIAVTNPYLRHPAVTASAALTVHELSVGRMMLGLGAGGDLALEPMELERVRPLASVQRALRIIRALSQGKATEGYVLAAHAIDPAPLPLYVGARGERLNRLASEAADGVFVGGVPISLLGPTLCWARSVRPLRVAVFMNVVFDEAALETARPQQVWVLRDSPPTTHHALGLDPIDVAWAAKALCEGDERPAQTLVNDEILDDLVLHGTPETVGRSLLRHLTPHRPDTVGLSVLSSDLSSSIPLVAEALAVATRSWP